LEFNPGICLTTVEKARKNLSQVKKNLSQSTVYNMLHVVIHRFRKIEITLRRIGLHSLKLLGLIIIYVEVLKTYRLSEKDCTLFNFYFLGAQCVESGVSCTDCY
jgi:uncharacterized membrane protein YqjE